MPDSSPSELPLYRRGNGWVLVNARLAEAAKHLDLSTRGTPEELAERDREEVAFWAPFRRRANALLDL
jgi:hypothetical protein